DEHRIGTDHECVGTLLHKTRKGRVDLTIGTGAVDLDLSPNRRSRRLHVFNQSFGANSIFWIDEHRDARRPRQKLVQEAKPLRPEFRSQADDAGDIAARPIESGDETSLDWITASAQNDWNWGGGGFGREGRCRADRGNDDSHSAADQVGGQS